MGEDLEGENLMGNEQTLYRCGICDSGIHYEFSFSLLHNLTTLFVHTPSYCSLMFESKALTSTDSFANIFSVHGT